MCWGAEAPMTRLASIHTLKVTLRHVRPVVWRRLEISSSTTLGEVHEILQVAFDWEDDHLHVFECRGRRFGPPEIVDSYGPSLGPGTWTLDEDVVSLETVVPRPGDILTYTYDFGDNWQHDLVVEQIAPAAPDAFYPACTAGTGLPPEEDSGDDRPGSFGEDARNRLNASLRRTQGAVTGRQLPTGEGPTDTVFTGLLPDLLTDRCECPCGCGAIGGTSPVMPVYDPAADDALASLAARSELVRRAVKLATWLGDDGRRVTPSVVLGPADAVAASRLIGLTPPEKLRSAKHFWPLHAVWCAAIAAGVIDIRGGKARAGNGLAIWQGLAVPSARLENWARMLAGMLRAADDEAQSSRSYRAQLRQGTVAAGVLVVYSTPGDVLNPAALALAVTQIGDGDEADDGGFLASLFDLPDLTAVAASLIDDWLLAGILEIAPEPEPDPADGELSSRGLAAELAADLRERVDQFESGPVEPDSMERTMTPVLRKIIDDIGRGPVVRLTPLGSYGLGRLLIAHGWEPPVAGACADLPPEEILEALMGYLPDDAAAEYTAWLDAQGDAWERASVEVARSAAVPGPEGPARRLMLMLVWAITGPRVLPVIDALLQDPWLSAVVATTLHAAGAGPEPTLGQQLWLAVDGLFPSLAEDDEDFADEIADSDVIELLDQPGGTEAAVRLDHPHAAEVLHAVAAVIEDVALARRLREALSGAPQTRPKLHAVGGTGMGSGSRRPRRLGRS
ncbi:MAG: hypothetical protein QG622_2954 [Actinomycetota bacterium]|nr:hypothetical protein [Actinomycetota bacterium]